MSIHRSLRTRGALGLSACLLAVGCAATPPPVTPAPPVATPTAPAPVTAAPPPPAAPRDPFAVPGALQKETIPSGVPASIDASKLKLPPIKGKDEKKADPDAVELPAAPKECGRWVANKGKAKGKCDTRDSAIAQLDEAMAESDAFKRDAKLAALEACTGMPAGMVRALRADLGPAECGDVLVAPVLAAKTPPSSDVHQVLLALGLGARLRRTATGEPKLAPPFDKQRVKDFIAGPMAKWVTAQAEVVEKISRKGVELSFYARGIVAVEAGMAEMRIVEVVRSAPLPDEIAKDAELKDAYFSGLEQSLDPRKVRGRDAALVGLKDLAAVGVIADGRVDRARTLLSKMFGGRRIDALDKLALPAQPSAAPAATIDQRLASKLPTFYAGLLLAPEVAKDPAVMQLLAVRGVPAPQRKVLQQASDLPRDVEMAAWRAHMTMGQRYWRAVDFDEATALAVKLRGNAPLGDESTFMLALSLATRGGPVDAAQMMLVAPALSLGLGNIAALDAIAAAQPGGPFSGLAALDAAMIQQVSPPDKLDAAFWTSLAHRYRSAAGMLTDPELKKAAEQRARSADEIAKAAPAAH
ncbi:MAG: hypothetical protein HY898_20815 [Deltaproteobacteria bacterium]|nr:hypothetical protein [Deltaproteobacteria bacterium]